jgi:hypothetical protein
VRERSAFEYVIVRVMPRIERGECLNAGVILVSRPFRYLAAMVRLDRSRLAALAPYLDETAINEIQRQIDLVPRIAAGDPGAGPIASLGLSERWHWLSAPSSTIIQPSSVHTGLTNDPGAELQDLFEELILVKT